MTAFRLVPPGRRPSAESFFDLLSIRLVVVRPNRSRKNVSTDMATQFPNDGGTNMVRRFLAGGLACTLLLTFALGTYGEGKPAAKLPATSTNVGLEKMKKLVGIWVAADKDGKPTDQVVSVIKLTAGGSAVHETLFPGQPHEMISVYTADGPHLIMTHYCVLGNQPRMKADPDSSPNLIVFRFAGGTNLNPAKDKHMHEATLTILGDDEIETMGIGWENGAPAKNMCCGQKLIRKK
jgi:hypothetical protein